MQDQPEILSRRPLSVAEERTWAMLAHLSVLFNLVSGFLGIVTALIIYAIYRERSRYVAYQAFQAFLFQLVFWGGSTLVVALTWVVSSLLAVVLIGLLLIPLACLLSLLPLGAVGYGVVAGLRVNQGEDFRYWLVGEWVDALKVV
ncbi:MAG: hypothetical protein Fur0018_20030 [Anaerolineales bacterium]